MLASSSDPADIAYTWDLFISHASEDNNELARPLAAKLQGAGLRVWIDTGVLDVGDNLRRRINEGITRSRFAVVLFTNWYLKKKWTLDELDALLALERRDHSIVIPVLHEITHEELTADYPLLGNRLSIGTKQGLDAVAARLVRVVLSRGSNGPSAALPSVRRRLLNLLEASPVVGDAREFLKHHPQVLESAVGANERPTVVWAPRLGEFSPDAYVSNFLPTRSRREWYVVLLGPLDPPLFCGGRPIDALARAVDNLDGLRHWLAGHFVEARQTLSDVTAEFSGVVVAGRRAALQAEEIRQLGELNDLLVGARVRTYDWLVESAPH